MICSFTYEFTGIPFGDTVLWALPVPTFAERAERTSTDAADRFVPLARSASNRRGRRNRPVCCLSDSEEEVDEDEEGMEVEDSCDLPLTVISDVSILFLPAIVGLPP